MRLDIALVVKMANLHVAITVLSVSQPSSLCQLIYNMPLFQTNLHTSGKMIFFIQYKLVGYDANDLASAGLWSLNWIECRFSTDVTFNE